MIFIIDIKILIIKVIILLFILRIISKNKSNSKYIFIIFII
jgi:hypothetical protein